MGALVAALVLVVPIAGNWRGTQSTLVVTSQRPADVKITFGAIVYMTHVTQRAEIDVARTILKNAQAVGSLRIESDEPVNATLTLFDASAPERGAKFEAVPADQAMGTGQSARITVHRKPNESLRLFVAETRGFPLYFSAAGHRYYVGGFGQSTQTIDADGTIELHGINGSGRIVAAAAAIAPDKTITSFAMTGGGVRHRMPAAEIAAYGLIAIAVIIGALYKA